MGKTWVPVYDWASDRETGCITDFPQEVETAREDIGGYDMCDVRILINDVLGNKMFATPGRRNNDAVNICIVLYALGFSDDVLAEDSIEKWIEDHLINQRHMQAGQISAFMDHVDRVIPYVKGWCDSGHLMSYVLH